MTADSGQTPPSVTEILERLDTLTAQLGTVAENLGKVSAAFHSTRRQGVRIAVALGVSFALDVALTVVVTLLSLTSLSNTAAIHSSQLAACSIGNTSRADQIQLWNYVIQLSGGTETQKQAVFLQFVEKTFSPVDCAKLYK